MIRRLAARLLVRISRRLPGRPPYAFHDQQGRAYYAWTDLSDMPRRRRLQVDEVMLWVDAGRPESTMIEIGDAIKGQASKAAEAKNTKDRSDALASIFKLSDELLMRSTLVPEECLLALCAATCMREDEQPHEIDAAIHADKIKTFREAGRIGHVFFFTAICRPIFAALYTTEGAWQELLQSWVREEARRQAVIKICTSGPKSAG